MSLTQELEKLQAKLRANHSDSVRATMSQATDTLLKSGLAEQALKQGDRIPEFDLPNATGKTVSLAELLKAGPVVVTFYRGGWCPYCNLELRMLQQVLPEMRALGATLVAISPETPDNSLSTAEKNELTFEVLSDVENQFAKQIGLVFTLPVELQSLYEQFGINVPAHNGDRSFELPIPATYVIDVDGTVVHSYVDPDYTKRLDPADIVLALKQLPSHV